MDLAEMLDPRPIEASIAHGRIALRSEFGQSEIISEIPGSKFHGSGQDYWSVPLTWTSMACLVNSFPGTFKPNEELVKWASHLWDHSIEPVLRLRTGEGESFVTDDMLYKFADLMPSNRSPVDPVERRYQVAGMLLLATAERFLLLDEQGTGKMTQGAGALKLYEHATLPALIVAPASTLYTWGRELELFDIPVTILDGDAARRRRKLEDFTEGVLVCSYGILSKHSRVAGYGNISLTSEQRTPKELNAIDWNTVLADEVHRAKSPTTVQTRALWAVSQNARFRWGMTGTPVEKDPLDFWSLLHYVDPNEWPSSVKMRDRWVDHYETFFGSIEVRGMRADRLDEWRQVSERYWRRKELKGLPPFETEVRFCELKGKQLKAYKDMEKQLMAEVGDDDAEDMVLFAQNHMVKAGRLCQMANSSVELEEVYDEKADEVKIIVTPIDQPKSPKLDLMMDTLEDYEGVPKLLWFKHVKLMRLAEQRLMKAGIQYAVIDGTMSSKQRDDSLLLFQNGHIDTILLSISAASEGITLTRAPLSIVVERDWSLIKEDQKGKRNYRIGSEIHDEIREINLVVRDTIEEDQFEDLEEKRKMRDQVVSPLSAS